MLLRFILFLALLAVPVLGEAPREIVAQAILESDAEARAKLIAKLSDYPEEEIAPLFTLWRESIIEESGLQILAKPGQASRVIVLDGTKDEDGKQAVSDFITGQPVLDEAGKPLRIVASGGGIEDASPDARTRIAMKRVLDLLRLSSPVKKARLSAVEGMRMQQDLELVPLLEARLAKEQDSGVLYKLKEAIAMLRLNSESDEVKIAACKELGQLDSIASQDSLKQLIREAGPANKPAVAEAANEALKRIAEHLTFVNTVGTVFSGISAGSVLLVAAIGLAITFGLMGVINMAHGEMIAIGAYTTYVVQCIFGKGFEASPFGVRITLGGLDSEGTPLYEWYFVVALPLSFLVAALVGIGLERSVIRFLYRRPLESLLATWGVSLVLQQLFRLTFGASNVQVSSPAWLSGNWTVSDITFNWNRVFVIGFAVAIIIGTHLLLKKTPLGLLIRSVMQNRQMAACVGVRTERVNMMTFAFGSGLAGLAGAFLSLIGNVGPSMGQAHIVNSFMTVVVGGVGNLLGTVISALGIGMAEQSLQQILGDPVWGKIIVLGAIVLFLQWRPAGLFVTKSRSLES